MLCKNNSNSVNLENPLEIAIKLGESIGGDIGATAFQELELAYVNSILPRFSNNSLIRMRQNILLYWHQSYHKSTLLNEFNKCLPDDIKRIFITSNSPETLFGTINDQNQIVTPLFANVDIANITELSTFVNARNASDIVNTMNKVLEGEKCERQLLKLGRRELSDEEISFSCDKGIFYDPIMGQLSYTPNVSVFAGSRPLDNRTYTYLVTSGYFYRHHIIQFELSDQEVKKFLKENHTPDSTLYEPLKTLNIKIKSAKIKIIETPNDCITNEIMDSLFKVVDEQKSSQTRLGSIIDMRTKGDIFRELVAAATLRSLTENGFQDIDQIQYTREDVDFIIRNLEHFIEAKVNPLFTDTFSKTQSTAERPIEQVKKLIVEFLADGNKRSRAEIDAYVQPRCNVCYATISNAVAKLSKCEDIKGEGFGYYRKK